jgi:hypothetical protein
MTDDRTLEAEFDFHGDALDDIFSTYPRLRAKCPVGRGGKYGGFWYLTKNEDIFAAEQDPVTFSVAPSMLRRAIPAHRDHPRLRGHLSGLGQDRLAGGQAGRPQPLRLDLHRHPPVVTADPRPAGRSRSRPTM